MFTRGKLNIEIFSSQSGRSILAITHISFKHEATPHSSATNLVLDKCFLLFGSRNASRQIKRLAILGFFDMQREGRGLIVEFCIIVQAHRLSRSNSHAEKSPRLVASADAPLVER